MLFRNRLKCLLFVADIAGITGITLNMSVENKIGCIFCQTIISNG